MKYWDKRVWSSLRPIKHCCYVNPDVLQETTNPDWEFDYIDIGSVSLSEGVTHKERMRFATAPSRARKPVRGGDVLVSTVRTYLKAIATIEEAQTPQIVSTGFAVLRAKKGTDARFLYRVVQSSPFVEQVVAQSTGVSYPAINPSTLSNIKIPLPDIETQRQIADFLDRETGHIDALIAKKEAMIALMKEKREIMISDATTGHPRIALRHLAEIKNSNVDKIVSEKETPVRLCNYVDVYRNDFISPEMEFNTGSATQSEIKNFRLHTGDVIITKDSENRHDIGIPAYVCETAEDLVCGYHLTILRPNKKRAVGEFLFWALQSNESQKAFAIAANGVTRYGLTQQGIKSLALWAPDINTQKRIAASLTEKTANIDRVVALTRTSIERLKEYRSALITEAVTGQIDVETYKSGQMPQTTSDVDTTGADTTNTDMIGVDTTG